MTTIVFLHGVGGAVDEWDEPLVAALAARGHGDIPTRTIRFDDIVDRRGRIRRRSVPMTPAQPVQWSEQVAKRRAYFERQELLAQALKNAPDVVPKPRVIPPLLMPGELLVRLPAWDMRHAGHYRHDLPIQREVLDRVAQQLNAIDDDVIVLGHSLGAVVAIDLIHLRSVEVKLLVTIGSSLGAGHFWCKRWEGERKFPYDRVGGWANVVNLRDFIPWQRGASWRFPQTVDVFLKTGKGVAGPGSVHDARTYNSSGPVIEAIVSSLDH